MLLGVAELAVHFVGEKEEVVSAHQVADFEHFLFGIYISGGVVGVADKYAFGAWGDEFLELLDRRQAEAVVDFRHNRNYLRTCRHGKGHVVCIGRLGHYNFITGVEARHEAEEDGFGAACSDDNIVDTDINAKAA